MKTRLLITCIIVLSSIILIPQTFAEECSLVEIKYTFTEDNGPINFCKLDESNILVGTLGSSIGGTVSIEVPRKIVDAVLGNCEPDSPFVLINGMEVKSNVTTAPIHRTIDVELPVGEVNLEIIGSFPLVSPLPTQYCGSSHGYVSQYAPPLKQIKADVPSEKIFCNEGKVLIFKHSDQSPACVKSESIMKLIERKWAKPIPPMFRDEPVVTKPVEHYLVDPADHIAANNQFALDYYSMIFQNDNNIFFSPTSISTAFSILYEGAQEDTAKEIQKVFGFPENELERKHGYLSLHNSLNEKTNEDLQLQIANALWLAQDFEPLPEYMDTATTYYDSTVSTVDFVSDDGVNKINDWVKLQTKDKIEKLLEPGSTGSTTRMAITNAIYFKGMWEHPFDSEDTYEADFFVNPEKTVKVQMMTFPHKMKISAAFTEQMKMLELPYKNNTMSMLILLPNEIDGLETIEDSLTLENLENWKSMFVGTSRGIVIHIPKFSLETDYNLIQTLPDMGMPSVFDAGLADLSGITGYKSLYVSQAIHKAFVDVNEEGTEAAAATAIVTDESGGQSFKADHPFLFIIQDNATDQIMFIGRVVDPTV